MDLKSYLEQHETVLSEITSIKALMNSNNFDKDTRAIALHISTLAGRIKVHLSLEDKYLYPSLQEHGSEKVVKIAEEYQKEMGDLANRFTTYKNTYNTGSKILQNLSTFEFDTKGIFQAIEKRIEREEKELYHFIEE